MKSDRKLWKTLENKKRTGNQDTQWLEIASFQGDSPVTIGRAIAPSRF